MTEIRGLILPKDIDKFDQAVMEREVETMKVQHQARAIVE